MTLKEDKARYKKWMVVEDAYYDNHNYEPFEQMMRGNITVDEAYDRVMATTGDKIGDDAVSSATIVDDAIVTAQYNEK